jgi:hypothetical protein
MTDLAPQLLFRDSESNRATHGGEANDEENGERGGAGGGPDGGGPGPLDDLRGDSDGSDDSGFVPHGHRPAGHDPERLRFQFCERVADDPDTGADWDADSNSAADPRGRDLGRRQVPGRLLGLPTIRNRNRESNGALVGPVLHFLTLLRSRARFEIHVTASAGGILGNSRPVQL